MPETVTSNTIVNRAIMLIGDNQEPVTGEFPNFDDSAAGQAANKLYQGVVQTVARQFGYDFSRNVATLSVTPNTPPLGFTYEYSYPTNGIQVRTLLPGTITDANDPLPINFVVGNNVVSGSQAKVIWTNEQNAKATFTNQPAENLWDALFQETVVRLLASELGMAVAARPETAQQNLEASSSFGGMAAAREA